MPKMKDITGLRFGRLVAIRPVGKNNDRKITWLCRCDCGNEKIISGRKLRWGTTRSCGCWYIESRTKHGEGSTYNYHRSLEYRTWLAMKARCEWQKHSSFDLYGGRGIKICERWRENYENFLSDMGRKPTPQHSIDRIDCEGNYEPSNCRWATAKEQAANRRFMQDK